VSGCAGIDLMFKACDNEAKSGFVLGIELEPTVRENKKFRFTSNAAETTQE